VKRLACIALLVALPARAQAPDELPPGHPAVAPGGDPHAGLGVPEADLSRAMAAPDVASATESDAVPAGSIRVTVVDPSGAPLPNVEVQLGVMRQGGDRERTPSTTAADGVTVYSALPTGVGQAYRVNVIADGATYSSTPFQLPPTRGYEVRVTRLPTTHDERVLLVVIGQTFVEIHEERLHVIEEMQLSNLGDATYVFPEHGVELALPHGFLAFQSQPVMTDQRIEEVSGRGVALHGSLPPGRVTLAFAYDLPITARDMSFEVALPIRTYIYRVITDAPTGLRLDVDGMPRAIHFEEQGRPLLGTEIQRQPGEPRLQHLIVHMSGIPGPGPLRWIALAAAILLVLGGLAVAMRPGNADPTGAALADRRRELLEELKVIEAEFASGEIGPAYRQSQRAAIVRGLATVLHEEDRAAKSGNSRPA
jgi:hypothetical protein